MALIPPLLIDRRSPLPMYRQVETQLRSAILDGRLRPGSRLPSIRELSKRMTLGRVTVATAYGQLGAEGYLVSRVGSGTRVASELPEEAIFVRQRAGHALKLLAQAPGRATRWPRADAPTRSFVSERAAPETLRIDFRPGKVGVDLFPVDVWEHHLRDAWHTISDLGRSVTLDYPSDIGGSLALRTAITEYLGAARAVRCTPDQVVITRGAQGAMSTIAHLLAPGSRVVTEDPGYALARRAFRVAGHRLTGVPIDRDGLIVERLPAEADAAIITPSWQYPVGGTLPIGRRIGLLHWAQRTGAMLIEDDYDSELRYVGHPLSALQGLDDGKHVIYVGTFAKIVFPALRIGYAVVPASAVERFVAMQEAIDRGPAALEQLALAAFIRSGGFESHLRRLRIAYAERQQVMLEAIARYCGDELQTQREPAGMHVSATVRDDRVSASTIQRAAGREGIYVGTLAPSWLDGGPDRTLILGFAGTTPSGIRQGMAELGAIIRHLPAAVSDTSGGHPLGRRGHEPRQQV